MAVDKQLLLAAIDAGRENSYGYDEQSSLGRRRAQAIEAYLGLNTNPAPEGRSQIVDRTVYQTISTLLPSLVRIFASSSEEVCKCVPVGPEDEAAAEQTTGLLNHVVTQQNPWEQIAADWLHDAMLLNNGYCMAYWDSTDKLTRERYEGQSDDQIAALMQDSDVTVLEHTQRPDTEGDAEAQKQFAAAMQQWQAAPPGQPPPQAPQPLMLHDVTIERLENTGKVCIEALPPEHCYVSADTPNWTLLQCPYFEFRQQKTIADLRSQGLEVDDDVSDNEDEESEEDDARDRFREDSECDGEGVHGAMRRVWSRMIWLTADCEGDDKTRMYYVIAVGTTILHCEPISRIPVASLTAQPLPHRHPGLSVAETCVDIQDTKTAIKRGALDSLYLANSGRHVVSSRVSVDDMIDSRPGGLVRMLDDSLPGEGHVVPLTHPFVFDQAVGALEYFDQDAQNRTGASRYFSGTDAGAINKTMGGTIALQNMAAMRVEHIARMAAPAIEALFGIVQEIIAKHQNKALTIKLRGQWAIIDPQAWRNKRDVRISVGVGAGNKESMMQHLQGVLGAQMQVGMPLGLVGREQIHATNTEILKLAGFANPAKFWPDPQQLPPPQPEQSPEQIKAQATMQLEQFKAGNEQQKFQAEQQIEQQRMQMQAQVDQYREEMQARQKMLEAQTKAQMDAAAVETAAQMEMQKLAFDKWKAELDAAVKLQIAQMSKPDTPAPDGRLDSVIEGLRQIMDDINAPSEIVRGPDGRATGVKKGQRTKTLQRGPDGRAIGLQ